MPNYKSEVFELIIRDERTGDGDGGDVQGVNNKETESKETKKALIDFEASKAMAKSIVTSLSTKVGSITGNTVLQANINGAMKAVGTAFLIKANPLMGTFTTMLNLAMMAIDRNIETFWKNTEASEYRRRSGNYLSDRNR